MSELEKIKDLLPAYALNALDPEEEALVAAFLADCQSCTAEIERYRQTADLLLLAGVERPAPTGLKDRLLKRITPGEDLGGHPVSPAPGRKKLSERLAALFWRPAALAGLALILIIMIAGNLVFYYSTSRAPDFGESPSGMVAVPVLGTENAPEAGGFVMISEDGLSGALVVENLAPLGEDQAYQVWLAIDEENILDSGGLFDVDQTGYGGLRLTSPRALDEYTRIGVTIEPAAGSSGPTGARVLGRDIPLRQRPISP